MILVFCPLDGNESALFAETDNAKDTINLELPDIPVWTPWVCENRGEQN